MPTTYFVIETQAGDVPSALVTTFQDLSLAKSKYYQVMAAAAVSITGGVITDRRGSSDCPWITSLIYQVDTSTLYDQWAAAYEEYFETESALVAYANEMLNKEFDSMAELKSYVEDFNNTHKDDNIIILKAIEK